MTIAELEQTRAAWDAIAAGYDELVTPTGGWALPEDALRRVGLRPGMRFLDVACGSGALSIPGARLGAQVVAVDLSSAMIERLQMRARQEGLANLDGRVMDGHVLDLEDDRFDIAASQFGVMLFPDLPRALRELVRVTRPGGRVLMVVYGSPGQVEFLTFFTAAMQAVVPGFPGLPMDPPPLPFQVADPEKLRREMASAGLADVRVEPGVERLEFRTGKQMWDWVVNSNPIGAAMVAGFTDEQRADIQRVLDGMLRERSGKSGAGVLRCAVNIGIGTK
jgi:ubiquinone/menaquinone biosynthesis C-methylase UbiE